MLLRVAAGLAIDGSPEHRWRQVAVPVAALTFLLASLGVSSIIAMTERQDQRDSERMGLYAAKASKSDLLVLPSFDEWRNQGIALIWVQPTTAGARPVLPPGVAQVPEPGQSVVSPALDRLAATHPGLARRYPNRTVIDDNGLRDGNELIAYVRVSSDRDLDPLGSAVRLDRGHLVGEGPAARIGGFGSRDEDDPAMLLANPSETSVSRVALAAAAVLGCPALIVLAVGISAASSVRDHRFAVLRSIGAPTRSILAIGIFETLTLALPGLALASVVWAVAGPRLLTVPLVGHSVVPGDLALPWELIIAEFALAVVVTALLSVAVGRLRRPAGRSTRPAPDRSTASGVRPLPFVLAIVAFGIGRFVGGNVAADLYLAGMVCAVVGIPLIIPDALRLMGGAVARIRSTSAALAGRAMEWDPTRAARPFVGLGALLIVAVASTGYLALARHVETPAGTLRDTHAIVVDWLDPRSGDLDRLASEVPDGLVAPLQQGKPDSEHSHDDGAEHTHDSGLTLGATCAEIATHLPTTECDPNDPYGLPDRAEEQLAGLLQIAAPGPNRTVRLMPRAEMLGGGQAVALARGSYQETDERVRAAAFTSLTAPYVYSLESSVKRTSALVSWIAAGALTAVLVLGVGCFLALVDRLLAGRGRHRHLLNIGMPRRVFTEMGLWMFAVPYVAVAAIGLSTGLAICVLMVLPGVAMPWMEILAIGLSTAVIGFLGAVCVAVVGTREALRERE